MGIGIGMFLKHQVSAQHLASGQLIAGGSEMLRFSLICGEFINYNTLFLHLMLPKLWMSIFCSRWLSSCHPLAFTQQESKKKMNLDKRRPIRKWFVGIKDLCADWTSCKARQLVISYCFILFLHDLSRVMPWQLLLLGMFPIVKAGCGRSKPAHPQSFRSCTLFACICQEDKRAFPYCLHTICIYLLHKQRDY